MLCNLIWEKVDQFMKKKFNKIFMQQAPNWRKKTKNNQNISSILKQFLCKS